MRHLPARDRKAVPWKNGGGVTVEIAVHPEGAGFDTFDWRVSLASVASDGPFSLFPAVDRTLTVLTGAGIDLTVGGAAPVRLDPSVAPFAFPGDVAASATLVDGPIEDLNVMTRRGRMTHTVARRGLTAGTTVSIACPAGIVFVTGACRFDTLDLSARDAVLVPAARTVTLVATEDGAVFTIALG